MNALDRIDERMHHIMALRRSIRAIGETLDENDNASAELLLGIELWVQQLGRLAGDRFTFEAVAGWWRDCAAEAQHGRQ